MSEPVDSQAKLLIFTQNQSRLIMSKVKAFTLIELLVVVAIVDILMAILLPSLEATKRLASSSACLSNAKTLLTALIMYADDNDCRNPKTTAAAVSNVLFCIASST